jgi:adenosine deaminase
MTLEPLSRERLHELLRAMPKAELHMHIEGSLEPELKFALAQRNGIELPFATVEEMRATYRFDSLTSFLTIYYDGMRVLQTEPDFYDLMLAYLTKAAGQNVRYAEVFFDPQAHTGRGVPFDYVIRGLSRAIADAEITLGIKAQLIMCFLRDYQAEYAMATLIDSLPYRQWIAGIGLDSDERGNPPAKFAGVYARARQEGYRLTMHCDVDQENSVEHIRQAVEDIGVERIDHGSNALESPELVAEIKRRGLGFTVCPISNGFVVDGMKGAEIRSMLDQGLRVTINSDDPAYFGGYVNANYAAAAEGRALTRDDLVTLARNSFLGSFLGEEEKAVHIAKLEAYAA